METLPPEVLQDRVYANLNAGDRQQLRQVLPKAHKKMSGDDDALDRFLQNGEMSFSRPYALTHVVHELRHEMQKENLLRRYLLSCTGCQTSTLPSYGYDPTLSVPEFLKIESLPRRNADPVRFGDLRVIMRKGTVKHVHLEWEFDLRHLLAGAGSITSMRLDGPSSESLELLEKFEHLKFVSLYNAHRSGDIESLRLPSSLRFLGIFQLPETAPKNVTNLYMVNTVVPVSRATQENWRKVSPRVQFVVTDAEELAEADGTIRDDNLMWYEYDVFARKAMKYLKFPLNVKF